MRPTETTFLPVLAGIVPPDIRREVAGCSPHENGRWTTRVTSSTIVSQSLSLTPNEHEQRLKSRRPFSRHAAHLVANNYDPPKAWNDRIECWPTFHSICLSPAQPVAAAAVLTYGVSSGYDSTVFAPARARVGETLQLVGHARSTASCPCGHPTQTVEHVVTDCVLLKSPGDLTALLLSERRNEILAQRTAH